MARMHARKKGRSSSNKPVNPSVPDWVTYKKGVVEQVIVKLSKSGATKSMIGQHLRDEYGVPDSKLLTGKKIGDVLNENKLEKEFPEDLMSLFKKAINLRDHMKDNHKDVHNKRGLKLTESKIRRLLKYYKRVGKVEQDFRYDPQRVKLLLG